MQPKQSTDAPSPALVFELLMGHQKSTALSAAIEVGLFRALGEGPADAATLAQRCASSDRGIRILADFLTVNGLIRKENGVYSNTPTASMFLDPKSPACIAAAARFLVLPDMYQSYLHLADTVRAGTLEHDGTVQAENPIWVEFAHSMAPMMAPLAGPLGDTVLSIVKGPIRVLDIAAGHGLFGITIAKQNPGAKIVAVDWAPVLEVARANAAKAGVESRYELLPGSAFDVEYGGPFDAALLTNFLHHFDRPTCVGLLRKVQTALRPGGVCATLEFVPNEDRVSPPLPAAFALTMLAGTRGGDAYTFSELKSMYEEAGFRDMAAHPIPNSPHTIVTGVKA